MLTTGLALAVLTSTGFYMIYNKLPGWARRWMVKHSLLTDVTACVLTYILMGGTLTALFAAAFVGIIISIMLAILNNEVTAAAADRLVERIKDLQQKLVDSLVAMIQQGEPNGQSK